MARDAAVTGRPLDSKFTAEDEAVLALTQACDKLSVEYREQPKLSGVLRRTTLIGAGGTGLVYLATHAPSSRQYALKQMHKAHLEQYSSLGLKLALREKKAYEVFASPFIARCFVTFQDELSVFMVLELCAFDLFQARSRTVPNQAPLCHGPTLVFAAAACGVAGK